MFLQLLHFEWLYLSKQRSLPIVLIVFFLVGLYLGGVGQAPAQINFNSAYQITQSVNMISLSSVFVIMFFSISVVLRDRKHQMEHLIFSTPLKKGNFFLSRFLGVFLSSVIGLSLFLPGYLTGLSISDLDPNRLGPFNLFYYVWPFFVILVPNILFGASIIFSVSLLTKSNIATYTSAILIFILYFVISSYYNSPVLASSIQPTANQLANGALLDPFAGIAYYDYTQYWTPMDKNQMSFTLSGSYLWNRIIWICVSTVLLGISYSFFRYRKSSKRVKKKGQGATKSSNASSYFSVPTWVNFTQQFEALSSSVKLDILGIIKSIPFLILTLTIISAAFFELYTRMFEGGAYGESLYPYTNLLLDIVLELVPLTSLILIVFYSGELYWRSRTNKFSDILYSSPTHNYVFYFSNTISLSLVPILLFGSGILVCILFQLFNGFTDIDVGQYMLTFYHYVTPQIVFAIIAVVVQTLLNNKFLGMAITACLIYFLGIIGPQVGIEHPMLRLGYMPTPIFSNMTGYTSNIRVFHLYAFYWIAICIILSILASKFWKRETTTAFNFRESIRIKKWSKWEKLGLTLGVFLLGITGAYLFMQLNVKQQYINSSTQKVMSEEYERSYKIYDSIPSLHYLKIKTAVDLYPKEEKYVVAADYVLINKNKVPVSYLFISERKILADVTVENARLIFKDSILGTYLYKFDSPIQPTETVGFRYHFKKQSSPYKIDRAIVANGSYVQHRMFEPILGYNSSRELSNPYEREKRGLPKKQAVKEGDSHLYNEDASYGRVQYETIVSTDKNQKALASGNLVEQWSENNRNFYKYSSVEKILPSLAYLSANYELKEDAVNEIGLQYYYHSGHTVNHNTINSSAKATLEYCIENFGNYPFDHLRIAEIPSYYRFGGVAHPGLIVMVEDNLYLLDIRDTPNFDLVSKRTIHEVAHQWWGMLLTPKLVEGGAFLSEGFAKYTEGVLLEDIYGLGAVWHLNKQSLDRYFYGRSWAINNEPPLYLVSGQNYLAYAKSGLVMMSLRDLMGEKRLNNVLKRLTTKYSEKQEVGVHTLEFIENLYDEVEAEHHPLIDEWMKAITRYDLSIGKTAYKRLSSGAFEITFEVKAKRFKTLKDGSEEEIKINEPLSIGLFNKHPKDMGKTDMPLYLESHRIKGNSTTIKIESNVLPEFISIDPFLTRVDRNYSDNTKSLKK